MKAKPKQGVTKPFPIKSGSVTVKLYTSTRTVNGSDYPLFTVAYHDGQRRVRQSFGDRAEAEARGREIADKLNQGEKSALLLTSADRSVLVHCLDRLRPLNIPLAAAVDDYVAAKSKLPPGRSLTEAIEFFLAKGTLNAPLVSVQQVVDEFIASKLRVNRSDKHVNDLRWRLSNFAKAFQLPMREVTARQVEDYLHHLEVEPRTWLNHLRHIRSLFKFAMSRKYISRDSLDDFAGIAKPEAVDGEIETFSVDELRLILHHARPEILPWLAIAAFAGLRHEEIQRLDWSQVDLAAGFIRVPAAKAKTRQNRLVPITPNLRAWLAPVAQPFGRVSAFDNMPKQINWLVEAINSATTAAATTPFRWKHNGLRHAFISYRLALTKDENAVAQEAGNSPTMIFRHYRALVTEDAAKAWFAIVPASLPANVVPLPAAAVG